MFQIRKAFFLFLNIILPHTFLSKSNRHVCFGNKRNPLLLRGRYVRDFWPCVMIVIRSLLLRPRVKLFQIGVVNLNNIENIFVPCNTQDTTRATNKQEALDRDAVVLMSVFLQFHYNSHFFSSVGFIVSVVLASCSKEMQSGGISVEAFRQSEV